MHSSRDGRCTQGEAQISMSSTGDCAVHLGRSPRCSASTPRAGQAGHGLPRLTQVQRGAALVVNQVQVSTQIYKPLHHLFATGRGREA